MAMVYALSRPFPPANASRRAPQNRAWPCVRPISPMITNMDFLLQLSRHPLPRKAGLLVFLLIVPGLPGCREQPRTARPDFGHAGEAPPPVGHETARVSSPPAPSKRYGPTEPLEDWTFAPDVHAFHQVWQDRFTLSANEIPDADTLLPYADALALKGASWRLEVSEIRLVATTPEGHAHIYLGPGHPESSEGAVVAEPEELAALGWNGRGPPGEVSVRFDGLSLRIVGPIHAEARCGACHDYGTRDVVGVLVYGFLEIADD